MSSVNENKITHIYLTGGLLFSVLAIGIIGYMMKNKRKGKHIVISEVDHISVHNIAKYLTQQGFEVSKVPVDQYGRVRLNKLEKRIRDDTILV